MGMIHKRNPDKPHRCPECHTVAVRGRSARWWQVVTCPACSIRFAGWGWAR